MNRDDVPDRMRSLNAGPGMTQAEARRILGAANYCGTCQNVGVVVDSAGYPDFCPTCSAPTRTPGGPPREVVMLLHRLADLTGINVAQAKASGHSHGSWRKAERGGWVIVTRTDTASYGTLTRAGWDVIGRAPKPEHVTHMTGGWSAGPCEGGGSA